jgi:lipopolysaccharide export system permease protein
MSIIYKYLSREILKNFGIILVAVVCIYIAVDFFEKIDDFMEAGLPFSRAVTFFIYNTPFIVAQIMPVGLFLAILVVFGMMSKNNEIIALKSSGVSIYALLWPVISLGLMFTILLFFLTEVIVPITTSKAIEIWLREVRKEMAVTTREKNVWIKGNRAITHIRFYDVENRTLHGISLNRFDDDFNLIRRVDAKTAVFQKGKWILNDSMVQTYEKKTGKYKINFHDKKVEVLDFVPVDLKRVMKKSQEMNFKELMGYIKKVEKEGYDATIYRVDLQGKIAFPFVCIVLCLVGTGISFRGRINEGLPIVVAYGLGIVFLYWIFHSFCVSLGYGEMLPPLIAVWTANLLASCAGVLILVYVE